jgi:hypothetical protein
MAEPRRMTGTSKWDSDNLIKWGGGVLVFGGICGLITYALSVFYAAIFRRRVKHLDVAAHGAYLMGCGALSCAVVYLILS